MIVNPIEVSAFLNYSRISNYHLHVLNIENNKTNFLQSISVLDIEIDCCLTLRLSIRYARKMFRQTNIFYSLIHKSTCAYESVRNIGFSEDFMYAINGRSPLKLHLDKYTLC